METYLEGLLETIKEWREKGTTPLFSFIVDIMDVEQFKLILVNEGFMIEDSISCYGYMCNLTIRKALDVPFVDQYGIVHFYD